jgi:hypothetical protein
MRSRILRPRRSHGPVGTGVPKLSQEYCRLVIRSTMIVMPFLATNSANVCRGGVYPRPLFDNLLGRRGLFPPLGVKRAGADKLRHYSPVRRIVTFIFGRSLITAFRQLRLRIFIGCGEPQRTASVEKRPRTKRFGRRRILWELSGFRLHITSSALASV